MTIFIHAIGVIAFGYGTYYFVKLYRDLREIRANKEQPPEYLSPFVFRFLFYFYPVLIATFALICAVNLIRFTTLVFDLT